MGTSATLAANGKRRGMYKKILVTVFSTKFDEKQPSEVVEFDRADLDAAAAEVGMDPKNFPDLSYYLRSRAKELPPEVTKHGFVTLISCGKARYRLIKEGNAIELPPNIEERTIDGNQIPQEVRDVLLKDEQAIMSAVSYTRLLDNFLGAKCHHVQGHLRTTGALGQQVEADDVFVGTRSNKKILVSIEAKGINEKLGYSQMKSTINAVQKKFSGYEVVPVGIKQEADSRILATEYTFTMNGDEVDTIKLKAAVRYRVNPRPKSW